MIHTVWKCILTNFFKACSYLYVYMRECIQKFSDWVITKYTLTFGITG